jgi:tetratricopeptide (TPR) repeat protein
MYDESAIFIEMPVIIKARQDGNRRLVELEASNESVDSEGDVILQQALLGSSQSFLKSGHLDIDHLSEIGDRLGIANPSSYIVGNPVEVRDLGGGRTGVVGELHKSGRPKADELWESLKADPPVRWRASIYGFPLPGQLIDCRVTKAENTCGATRFLVKGLDWRSLAFTRNPINTSIKGSAQVVTAKSYLAVMKSRMPGFGGTGLELPLAQAPDYILPPRSGEEMVGHFLHQIAKVRCPCFSGETVYSPARFAQHFEVCCGESSFEAAIKGNALMGLLRKDRRVKFYPFQKTDVNVTGATRATNAPSTMRQVRTMNDLNLLEKFAAFLKGESVSKGHAHGGAPDSDKIEGIKVIEDIFNEQNGEHSIPSRSEIVTGPPEASSGGGAVRMVARYSDPAAQAGMTAMYDRFDGIMREFQKSVDARLAKNERAVVALATFMQSLQKAQQAEVAAKAAAQAAEETFLGKAEVKIAKAAKALRKSEMEEDEKDREERKSDLTSVLDTLKSAIKLLAKADEDNADEEKVEKALKLAKSLRDQVSKAIEAITKAEDEERKAAEKAEAAKKAEAEAAAKAEAEAAAKAQAEAAAKSETSQEEEKKDDTAKAEAAKAEQVEKALVGLGLEVTTVKGMIETLMNTSRTGVTPPPAFVKSETNVSTLQERLDEVLDSGSLNEGESIMARTLVQRQALAAAGRIPAEQVTRDIAAAPLAVRQIFQAAA